MARFFRRGKSKIRFLPAVADIETGPTVAEWEAGTDLSGSVAAINGFQLTNAPITTPDLATSFDSQIDGPDQAGDSSINFYDDDTAETVRTALAKGTAGFVGLAPYGEVAGKRIEVWPSKSTGVNDEWSMDATAALFQVGFAITGEPNQDATFPAGP